jgi:glucose-6-phosphate 1-dehydrogenase
VRKPGLKYELEPNDLVFDRAHAANDGSIQITDAYEEVLFDAICGDQTLFVSSAEQAAAWKYVTALLGMWHDIEPEQYTHGSDGPASPLKEEMEHVTRLFT